MKNDETTRLQLTKRFEEGDFVKLTVVVVNFLCCEDDSSYFVPMPEFLVADDIFQCAASHKQPLSESGGNLWTVFILSAGELLWKDNVVDKALEDGSVGVEQPNHVELE